MNRIVASLLLACLASAGIGMSAIADDTNTDRPVMTNKQMMKNCTAKERAENSNASMDDIKKTCRAKIKSYNDHPSESNPPPDNPGH
jgi:hypothetical protein